MDRRGKAHQQTDLCRTRGEAGNREGVTCWGARVWGDNDVGDKVAEMTKNGITFNELREKGKGGSLKLIIHLVRRRAETRKG